MPTPPSSLLRCLRKGSHMCTCASSQRSTNLFTVLDRSTKWVRMGEQICSAFCGNISQKCAVHFSSLEWPLPEVRHSSQAPHGLSSTGQWPDRTIPQAAEGKPQSKDWRQSSPLSDGGEGCSKGRLCTAFCQDGVQYGDPLALPGEFLDSTELPSASFLQQLRQQMSRF